MTSVYRCVLHREPTGKELASAVEQTPTRRLRRLPYHINDPEFAEALVEAYLELT